MYKSKKKKGNVKELAQVLSKDKHEIDMLGGDIKKDLILFALPLMASGFLQLLFNAADLVVVGKYCGSNMVGAVGATAPLNTLIINFFMGFAMGVSVVVSNGLGEDNWKKVNRAVHASMPLALAFGTFVAVIGCILARPALVAMNTPEDILEYSIRYTRIVFIGAPASLVYNYGSAILKANGDTRRPLIYLTIAGVLNVILNVIFVTVFDLNVVGVALATTLTTVLSAFLTVRRLCNLTNCCRLQFKYMRFYKHACLRILKVGIPAGIQNAMFSVSNIIIQGFVNSMGTAVVSGASAAQSINGFQFVILNGISQGTVNFVGQNYGAQRYDRVKKTKNLSILYIICIAAFTTTFILSIQDKLLGIYITDSAEAIIAGRAKVLMACGFNVLNALFETYSACMRGIGSSVIPAFISIAGICGVRLLYIYTIFEQIPRFHTIYGLFACYPISWGASLLVSMLAYTIISKKRFAYHNEHMESFRKDTFHDTELQDKAKAAPKRLQ